MNGAGVVQFSRDVEAVTEDATPQTERMSMGSSLPKRTPADRSADERLRSMSCGARPDLRHESVGDGNQADHASAEDNSGAFADPDQAPSSRQPHSPWTAQHAHIALLGDER